MALHRVLQWTLLCCLLGPAVGLSQGPLRKPAGDALPWPSPGASVAGELQPATPWPCTVSLKTGEFLHLEVSQPQADLRLSVIGPDGESRLWDHPFGLDVPETAMWVAAEDGTWRGELRAIDSAASTAFTLTVVARRPATANDRLRAEAAESTRRHHRLDTSTPQSRDAALTAYGQDLALWQRTDDRSSEILVLRRMAQLSRRQGTDGGLAQAQDWLDRAQTLEGDPSSLSAALTWDELGRIHRLRGDLDAARRAYGAALDIFRRQGASRLAAGALNNLATVHLIGGDLAAARRDFERALVVFTDLDDRRRQTITATNLGGVEARAGRLRQASEWHRRALVSAEAEVARLAALDDPRQLSRAELLRDDVRQNLAVVLGDLGETGQALRLHAASLDGYLRRGDGGRAAAALASRGALLLELGEAESARQQLVRAQGLVDRQADPRSAARLALNLGVAWRDLGDLDAATSSFTDALELHRRLPDPAGEAEALIQLGQIAFLRSQLEVAEMQASEAMERARAGASSALVGQALCLRGQVLAQRGGLDSARRDDLWRRASEDLSSALSAAESSGGLGAAALAHLELGRLAHRQRDLALADAHLGQAIVRFEQLRSKLSAEGLARSLFASVRQAYELRIDVLMQQAAQRRASQRPDRGLQLRAFELADQAKARQLMAVLVRTRDGSPADRFRSAPEALRREEEELRHRLVGLTYRRRSSSIDAESAALDGEIESLLAEYRLLETRLEDPAAGPDDDGAASRGFAPGSLQAARTLWDEGSILLAFSLGEERSYAWRVTVSSFETFILPPRASLEAAARRLHRHLSTLGDARAAQSQALEALRSMLAPCFDGVAPGRWLVVTDGALAQVPLSVLVDPEAEVVQLPSLRVLREIRRRPAAGGPVAGGPVAGGPVAAGPVAGDLAILADPLYGADDPRLDAGASQEGFVGLPRLVWSGQEAAAVVRLAEGASRRVTLVSGGDAHRGVLLGSTSFSSTSFAGELLHHRVLHFATHTWLDERRPELSALVLSPTPDGQSPLLPVAELAALDLTSRMVVLSGCSTASGVEIRGEGLVGLSHAFLRAGAAQIVASLWPVDDRAGALFMEEFYRAMWVEGRMPSAALARARGALRRQAKYKDPYFWAAFTLLGDWQDDPWAAAPTAR